MNLVVVEYKDDVQVFSITNQHQNIFSYFTTKFHISGPRERRWCDEVVDKEGVFKKLVSLVGSSSGTHSINLFFNTDSMKCLFY